MQIKSLAFSFCNPLDHNPYTRTIEQQTFQDDHQQSDNHPAEYQENPFAGKHPRCTLHEKNSQRP